MNSQLFFQQVIHNTKERDDFLKLYIVTRSEEEQVKWVNVIRTGERFWYCIRSIHVEYYTECTKINPQTRTA